jgi:hypothetical protein
MCYIANERGSLKIDQETGKEIEWSKFLPPIHGNETTQYLQPKFSGNQFVDLDPKDQHVVESVWPMDSFNQQLLDHVHPRMFLHVLFLIVS